MDAITIGVVTGVLSGALIALVGAWNRLPRPELVDIRRAHGMHLFSLRVTVRNAGRSPLAVDRMTCRFTKASPGPGPHYRGSPLVSPPVRYSEVRSAGSKCEFPLRKLEGNRLIPAPPVGPGETQELLAIGVAADREAEYEGVASVGGFPDARRAMLPISLTIGVPPGVGVLSDGREQNAALDQRTLFLRALAAWALSAESGLAGSLTLDALDRYAEDPRDALALAEATGADLLLWPIPIIGPPDALEWRAVRPTWVGALGAAIGRAVQPMGKSSTVGRLPWKRRLEPGSPLLRWGREAVQLLLYEFAAHSGLWRAASVYAQSLVDSAPDSLARRSLLIECWLQLNDPDRLEEEAVALERLTTNAVVRSSGRRLRGIAEGMRGRLSQELARYMEAGLIGEDTPEEEQASRAIRDMLRRLGGTYPFYTEVPDPNAYRILIRWAQICKGSAATCVAFSTESTVFNIALATGPGKESVRVRVGAYANHLKEPSSTHLVWKHGLEVFDDDYDWKCVVPKNPPRDES